MKIFTISLVALASSFVVSQDIDDNDVPIECRAVCASIVSLTTTCDSQNDDDDLGYISCVCSASNAASEIPACEACIANYDTNDGHDNDVNDLIRSCSFTITAFVFATADLTTLTGTSPSSTDSGAGGFTIQTSTPSNGVTSTTSTSGTSTPISTSFPTTVTTATAGGDSTSMEPTSTSSGVANLNGASNPMGLVAAVFLGALGAL